MFVRKKNINGRDYHYLVKSQRIEGKVVQKVVKYIGAEYNPRDLDEILSELEGEEE